jgi:hypothetical protein
VLTGTASMLRLSAGAEPTSQATRVLLRLRPHVVLPWKGLAPRLLLLDLEPAPGTRRVARGAPERDRDRPAGARGRTSALPLSAARRQRRRLNQLRLDFASGAGAGGTPPASARLYAVAVGPDADPALHDLAAPGAPPPLSVVSAAGAPALVQAAPGAIGYAIRVPDGGELRFTPTLHPAARSAGATVSVAAERDGSRRDLEGHAGSAGRRANSPADPRAARGGRASGAARERGRSAGSSGRRRAPVATQRIRWLRGRCPPIRTRAPTRCAAPWPARACCS